MAWYVYVLIGCVLLLLIGGVSIALLMKKGTNPQSNKKKSKRKDSKKRFLQAFYKRFPLTRNLYSKTFNRLSAIQPSEVTEIHEFTTKTLSTAIIIALLVITYGIATSQGNIIYILAHCIIAYIIISLYVDIFLETKERELLYSLKNVLPKISKAYDKCKIVEDAIYEVYLGINDDNSFTKVKGIGKLFKKSGLSRSKNAIMGYNLERLYKVLTAPSSKREIEIQKYISSSPNVYLNLLLSICTHIQKNGDNGMIKGTGSTFKKQIYELQELVNDDVINTQSFHYAMKPIPFICLLCSLPLIKPLELFCYYCSPDLKESNFFNGAYGVILIAVAFAVTIFCYYSIMQIKCPNKPLSSKLSVFYKISENRSVKKYLNAYITKHFSKAEKTSSKLKSAGKRISVRQFYIQKITFAVLGFALTLGLCVSGVVIEKIQKIPSFAQSFEESVLPNDNYRKVMQEATIDIASMTGTKVIERETITEMVANDGRIKNPDHIDMIVDEIMSQNETYQKIRFECYYVLVALFFSVLAFFLPDFFLKKDLAIAKMRKSDEVNQFRSIISLLMDTGGITVDVLLKDMQMFADYYKEPISKCIVSLDRNEQKALMELKASEKDDEDFVDIVDGLLNIYHTGVAKSFETLRADKQFYREQRKNETERNNKSKISKANLYWQIPFYVTVAMTLFIPMGIPAIEMFLQIGTY